VKIYAADKSELMQVSKIERHGDDLVLKGKVFGTMPMSATLTPEQARAASQAADAQADRGSCSRCRSARRK
jgi:hypothetical protein